MDSHSSPSILYQPLSDTTPSIRLLHLEQGDFDSGAPIICSLSTTVLDDNPVYEALSYEWGPPATEHDPTHVVLNGKFKTVSPNLWAALRRLRAYKARTIWIDALCINQDDLAERSAQVKFMGRIYRGAALVVTWLGEVVVEDAWLPADCNAVFAVMEGQHNPQNRAVPEFLHDVYMPQALTTHIGEISYWGRTWIIQELLLASKLVIQYSDYTLDPVILEAYMQLLPFTLERAKVQGMLVNPGSSASQTFLKLSSLLVMSRVSQVTNARDKIYGLLGLVEPSTIPVDYTKTLQEVYHNVVDFYVQDGQLEEAQKFSRQFDLKPLERISRYVFYGFGHGLERWGSHGFVRLYDTDTNTLDIEKCYLAEVLGEGNIDEPMVSNTQWLLLRDAKGFQLRWYSVLLTENRGAAKKKTSMLPCEGWRVETDDQGHPKLMDRNMKHYFFLPGSDDNEGDDNDDVDSDDDGCAYDDDRHSMSSEEYNTICALVDQANVANAANRTHTVGTQVEQHR